MDCKEKDLKLNRFLIEFQMRNAVPRKCPECRERDSLAGIYHHLILIHDYEEFLFFRYIDVTLKLAQFNEGYRLKCTSRSCKEIVLGSHELFNHLKTEHHKSVVAALSAIETLLKRKEKSYYELKV